MGERDPGTVEDGWKYIRKEEQRGGIKRTLQEQEGFWVSCQTGKGKTQQCYGQRTFVEREVHRGSLGFSGKDKGGGGYGGCHL